jgi:hypothetical protein
MIVQNWQISSHKGSQVHFVLDGNQTHNFSGDRHWFHAILPTQYPTKKDRKVWKYQNIIYDYAMSFC